MSTCLEKFGPSKWDITTSQVLEISNSKKPSRVGGPCMRIKEKEHSSYTTKPGAENCLDSES